MSRHKIPTPGDAILESLEWLKMEKSEYAQRLGIGIDYLEKLILGEELISNEIASSLESVTGSPAAYWKMLSRKNLKSNG